jgi:hypothetical protein
MPFYGFSDFYFDNINLTIKRFFYYKFLRLIPCVDKILIKFNLKRWYKKL